MIVLDVLILYRSVERFVLPPPIFHLTQVTMKLINAALIFSALASAVYATPSPPTSPNLEYRVSVMAQTSHDS